MTKKIRLMADYGCYPLWGEDLDEIGDIDPTTLPLSQDTLKRLDAWRRAYEAILNWDDPASSGFSNKQAREAFNQEGISLWERLRKELSPDYEVLYFSEMQQKLLTALEFSPLQPNF